MKKTLLLMALLGSLTAQADYVNYFVTGYNENNIQSAYHNQIVGSMCWGANASNVLAWWQDQLVTQGYNLPKDVPKGNEIYSVYQQAFSVYMKGANTPSAMNWWITGQRFGTQLVDGLGGYYQGLLTQDPGSYYMQQNLIGSCGPGNTANLKGFSAEIIDNLNNGRVLLANLSGSWNVTIWGVRYDTDTEQISHVYYTDPHDTGAASKIYCSELRETYITGGDNPLPTFYLYNGYTSYNGTIMDMYSLTCKVDEFLTAEAYTDKGNGAFAPIFNVEVDNGTCYTVTKELKAAEKGSALEGVVNGDVTMTNGTVKIADQGSTEGAVIFAQSEDAGATRKLSVQRTRLMLSSVKVDAASGNTLEVTTGNDVTITATTGEGTLVKTGEGALVNGGSLGNLVVEEGTVKGVGSFAGLTVDGGTLIVGNSPGQQTFTGNLSVNKGDIVFSVSDWGTAAADQLQGWSDGAYSNVKMNGTNLTFGEEANLKFAVGGEALTTLLSGQGGFSMDIATGLGNGAEYFTSELLNQLALATTFYVAGESGALAAGAGLAAGTELDSRIHNLAYNLKDGGVLCVSGSFEQIVPEPATGTLGLLALAALAARRRKRK